VRAEGAKSHRKERGDSADEQESSIHSKPF
jgi:hypothetical protein